MIDRIRALFAKLDAGGATGAPSEPPDKPLAAAALLVEAACQDGTFDAEERRTVRVLVRRHFALTDAETESLLAEAEAAQSQANHLLRFTRAVKDAYAPEERHQLLEMMWEVAYADGELHAYEANLLRRVAGLLYVPDRESGAARKRVLARLGIVEPPPAEHAANPESRIG